MLTAPETQEVEMQGEVAQILGVPQPEVTPILNQDPLKGESLLEGLSDAVNRNQGGEGTEKSVKFRDILLARFQKIAGKIPGGQLVIRKNNN